MAETKEVFLSHCVASMGEKASRLNDKIQGEGCTTFICTKMDPGQEFRQQITINAANCKIMVIFLDERWANSKECLSEFNCAYSCYNKGETPQIIPIIVGGFQWIDPRKYPITHCITSNFQCLAPKDSNAWEELNATLLQRISAKIAELKAETTDAMKKLESQNQVFMDFVTCEICQDIFRDPRMLPCCHSFCKICLINWKKGKKEFTCPKCRISCSENIDDLKPNSMAKQIIEVINVQNESGNSAETSQEATQNAKVEVSADELECETELAEFFKTHKIPTAISKLLVDNGFDCLDVVLEISDEEIKSIGLKLGHEKKLKKSINDHKNASNDENSNNAESYIENWKLVKELYDDRILTSGSKPTDALKFWASLTKQLRENIVQTLKKLTVEVRDNSKMPNKMKAECLEKLAMVLCDGGEFADAESAATSALTLDSSPDRQMEIKVVLIYAMNNKLKQPMWIDDTKDNVGYETLAELCRDVIENQKILSKAKLCKVYLLKAFTLYSIVNRSRSLFSEYFPKAEVDLGKAVEICEQENLKGLKAEALMTQSLMMAVKSRDEQSRQTMLRARKLCLEVYGEFCTLSARIYYNLGIDFEMKKDKKSSYECFRRSWLIDRQVLGVHHPETKKSGSVLTEDYQHEAQKLKDVLPETFEEPTQKDRDYTKRVKFLDKMTK